MFLFASLDPLSIFGPIGLSCRWKNQIFAILICSKQLHLPQDPEVTTATYVEDEGQKGEGVKEHMHHPNHWQLLASVFFPESTNASLSCKLLYMVLLTYPLHNNIYI